MTSFDDRLYPGRYSKPVPIHSTSQQQQKSNSNTEQNKGIVCGKHQINAGCAIKLFSKNLIAACISSVCDTQEELRAGHGGELALFPHSSLLPYTRPTQYEETEYNF